jgi:hypothetical protein
MKDGIMKSMNAEIKKVVSKVKDAQTQLQGIVKSHDWVEEARKYAERQGKEVKKLFAPDVEKMKTFLERERKELERFQKQIPGEVKKFKKFVDMQKKEFERLLTSVRKMNASEGKGTPKTKSKKTKAAAGTKGATGTKSTMGTKKKAAALAGVATAKGDTTPSVDA